LKPSSSKTSSPVVRQGTSPTNPIRKAREENKWSKGITLKLLNESNRMLHDSGIITSRNYIGISTYNRWENGTQPRKERALILCKLFGKSCSELGLRSKTELPQCSKYLVSTSASIPNAAKANGFASGFPLSNHSLPFDLYSSFINYRPSHFNTLYNLLIKANPSGNDHDLLAMFRSCISILEKKIETASAVEKMEYGWPRYD
jgi:hypothetical protein